MVIKLIFLIFIFISNISYSNIIYDKNGISITNNEVEKYINIYENNNQLKISKNKAIKNIVLMKKTIDFLLKNNSEFMLILDQNIEIEFGNKILNEKVLLNYIRFQKIRNEFISEYFQNSFDIQDFEIIISNLDNFILPISKNKCLTIEKLHKFDIDKNFSKSLYNSLKNRKKEFEILINNQQYDVCISNQIFNDIENIIIKFIENKTEDDFNKFIYEKIN
jgi:hypothetical protein